ncbi:hypothetical protein H5410_010905 [Solanum commersonii]|uniref:Uncharacterized protein n=1 Tax=Solanum commersonii TaxID=4109 RepID=A0A9J6ANQ3_SOLCO|nr:hypothetical protein H5410_010905 [Solanum commersonii]
MVTFPGKTWQLLRSCPISKCSNSNNNSFYGDVWKLNDDVQFKQLKFLLLDNVYIKRWEASSDNFPNLRRLVLQLMCHLDRIPLEFVDICTLESIELYFSLNLLKSAREIEEEVNSVVGYDFLHVGIYDDYYELVKKRGGKAFASFKQVSVLPLQVGMQNSALGVVLETSHFSSSVVALPAATSDCFRAIVRQNGQYGVCINHESMHLRWKLWLQFVSNLQFSPVLNLSKHTAHSEVSSVLSLSVSSTLYRKQGSFFKSSSDIFVLPPLLLLLRTTRPFSAVCLIKDLPCMQK